MQQCTSCCVHDEAASCNWRLVPIQAKRQRSCLLMIVVCQEQNALFIVSDGFRTSGPDYEWPKEGVHFLCARMSHAKNMFPALHSPKQQQRGEPQDARSPESPAWSWGLRSANGYLQVLNIIARIAERRQQLNTACVTRSGWLWDVRGEIADLKSVREVCSCPDRTLSKVTHAIIPRPTWSC